MPVERHNHPESERTHMKKLMLALTLVALAAPAYAHHATTQAATDAARAAQEAKAAAHSAYQHSLPHGH